MTRQEILNSSLEDYRHAYMLRLNDLNFYSSFLDRAIQNEDVRLEEHYRSCVNSAKKDLDEISFRMATLEKEISKCSDCNWLTVVCKKFNLSMELIYKSTGIYKSILSYVVNNDIHYSKVEFRLILGIATMLDMTLDEFYGELKKTDIDEFY